MRQAYGAVKSVIEGYDLLLGSHKAFVRRWIRFVPDEPRGEAQHRQLWSALGFDRDEKLAVQTLKQLVQRRPLGRLLVQAYRWRHVLP